MKPDEEPGLRPIGEIVSELPWMRTLASRVVRKPTISERLRDIAARVKNNTPDGRAPERFHIEKSEIVHELEEIAMEGM